MLARHIKTIIIIPILFSMAAVIYGLFFTTPVYHSTAKIMSASGTASLNQAAGIAATFGINLPVNQTEPKWVYPEIIKSRTLAKSMLKREFTTEKYGNNKVITMIISIIDR